MDTRTFKTLWKPDGSVHDHAPAWARRRADMRAAFPTYYSTGEQDPFAKLVGEAIRMLDHLKPARDGPGYLGADPSEPAYDKAKNARLAPGIAPIGDVLRQSADLFQGMPNWNHPLTMPNVIPPANSAGIIAAMMTEVFSPNIIEGEYSWNVEFAELESAAIVADLIGWDTDRAGGLFTFGGSGCYFYGLKYALARVLPDSRTTGVRTDAKLLVSQQGHYCMQNASDWSGLGMNNIVPIKTDPKTNAMDMADLERTMSAFYRQGTPIAAVVCTMGTTDAFAMDPVGHVRELIEKYPNPRPYGKTLLYCDAVIGWSWLTFGAYDFQSNPLGFSERVLPLICQNYEAIKQVREADAIGCDFHKVGWAPYNCSLFMMRDANEFQGLLRRPGSDYLQERTAYNPGLYTLEVSRSGSYAMAGWATLKFFGNEGFQAILGGILEMQAYLRALIAEERSLVCVNPDDNGFVTLFRVYPSNITAKSQFENELAWPDCRDDLIKHNRFQEQVANTLWQWFREGKQLNGVYTPYTSYSTGFRPAEYNRDKEDPYAVIYALKSFPMNVNIDPSAMQTLLNAVLAARDYVEAEGRGYSAAPGQQ